MALGGGLIASGAPPGKEKFAWYRDFLLRRLERSGVSVRLGRAATAAEIVEARPDVVVVAAGTRPRRMAIEGYDSPMVLDAYEVLMGKLEHGLSAGQHLVIYGGGETGCEAAEYFAQQGIKVSLVSRSAADSIRSQRSCIGLIRPPPTPMATTAPPVSSTAYRTGSVTAAAIPTWSSAAMAPSAMMMTDAALARNGP